jgi:peptidoglycan/LPS O-acetylase OafA/YrhL
MVKRASEIDGIRGWAALIVAVFHFTHEIFQADHPFLNNDFLYFILNGHLMVLIFFILSGDALSSSFFRSRDLKDTARIALMRYFRLTFPIFVSCVITYVLMKLHLVHMKRAGELAHSEKWLATFLNFKPSWHAMLKYALADVYFKYSTTPSYNSFLWTMSVELLGSAMVFANIAMLSRVRTERYFGILLVEALFLLVVSEFLCLFIVGMMLGLRRSNREADTAGRPAGDAAPRPSRIVDLGLLVAFILYVAVLLPLGHHRLESLWRRLTLRNIPTESLLFLFAIVAVVLIYECSYLKAFFSTRLSLFLGDISYPLYILQFNVISSFTCIMIIKFYHLGILSRFYLISLASLVVTILGACAFRPVEKRFLAATRKIVGERLMQSERESGA